MTHPLFPDLSQKVILVTGASRGIGLDIVQFLLLQQAKVAFSYRGDDTTLSGIVEKLKPFGSTFFPLNFDVTDAKTYRPILDAFMSTHGPIEALVNNAGISKDTLALRLKEEEVDHLLNVNLKSAMMLTSFLSRSFLKVPAASVVNMSSVVGLMGNVSQVVYSATKAGLIGFTKSYAKEMSSKNVRANAICPGFIETDMTHALKPEVKDVMLKNTPLGRFGTPRDVSHLVAFLLSSASSFITGEVIKVDGGLYV